MLDGGCIPVGGSIGQIRPINLAWPLLEQAGLSLSGAPALTPATTTAPDATATPRPGLDKTSGLKS